APDAPTSTRTTSPIALRSDALNFITGDLSAADSFAVPLDRFLEAGSEIGLGAEPELFLGPGHIEAATRLPVRPGIVPNHAPSEARELCDQFDQLSDRDLHAGTEVHRLWTVISHGRHHDPLGRVLDVQTLTR